MEAKKTIQLVNISKVFGSIRANRNVTMTIRGGEILSLLGENGSGKTTLMNMLSGIYAPDEGQILIDGQEVRIASPADAFVLGIGMIHQHFKLVDVLTAAENIILGLNEKKTVDLKAVAEKVAKICDRYGFVVDPEKKVYDMSVSEKQTLEIVKVLYRGADVLILDEPTAVLTPQETEKLFDVMRNMKADGKSIIIITHKLHEVMEISDRVAVLRRGEYVGEVATSQTSPQELTDMMVGHAVRLNIDRPEPKNTSPRLVIEHLSVVDADGVERLHDVSFTAMSGEILGIAGISGSGQKELLEAIAGLQTPQPGGSIRFLPDAEQDIQLAGKSPMDIKKLGIHLAFVPEDRLGMGLVGSMDIPDNMMLRSYQSGRSIFTDRKTPKKLAKEVVEELGVLTGGLNDPISRMSGGNIQKVLVGREIAAEPSVLMTAYAVRGLDINTSHIIYRLLNEQKQKDAAVVFVGEDLDVLLELCDRILVLCEGRVSGIVDGRTARKEQVGLMMTHLDKEAAQ